MSTSESLKKLEVGQPSPCIGPPEAPARSFRFTDCMKFFRTLGVMTVMTFPGRYLQVFVCITLPGRQRTQLSAEPGQELQGPIGANRAKMQLQIVIQIRLNRYMNKLYFAYLVEGCRPLPRPPQCMLNRCAKIVRLKVCEHASYIYIHIYIHMYEHKMPSSYSF